MATGRLEKAAIQNLESGESNAVQFNPAEYQVEKQVGWKEQTVAGRDAPAVEFTNGARRKLTVTLVFDTSEDGSDVRDATSRVEGLAFVDRTLKTPRPPRLLFRWGGFEFRGVMESCSSRYILFSERGTPLRAELKVSLGEFPEESPSAAASSDAGEADEASATLEAGERIDQLAERVAGDPEAWPELAEANDIDDPLDVPPGTEVRNPRSPGKGGR